METALLALLVGDSAITTLVAKEAICWSRRIGLPAIALHLISGLRPDVTMGGPSGLMVSTVQVDCWASTYEAAARIRDAVLARASAYYGAGVLHLILVEGGGADFEHGEGPAKAGEPANFHRQRLDLRVWHINP